jgi:hypothetical protein
VSASAARLTPLPTYVLRRTLTMHTPLAEQLAHVLVRERQLRAEAENQAARLVTVRRWQRLTVRHLGR